VGKVGTESATFIEPVANRKDGIQAMFSKQVSTSSAKPTHTTKTRLKRSRSPSPIKTRDTPPSPPSRKRPKVEKSDASDVDSDVVVLHEPSTPKKVCPNSPLSSNRVLTDIW